MAYPANRISVRMYEADLTDRGNGGVRMISTKGRYALRVMVDLAQHSDDGYIPLDEIAHRQGISKKYLEIILKVLVQNGLLRGLRGKGGGYMLTRSPQEYTIGEILTLEEGTLACVACLQEGADRCPRETNCVTLPMWKQFDVLVHDFFYGITLDTLMQQMKEQEIKKEERKLEDNEL